MKRMSIDAAAYAQVDRMTRLIRDIQSHGGTAKWSELLLRGHKFPTVRSALAQGYLKEPHAYEYVMTHSGWWYINTLDDALAKE